MAALSIRCFTESCTRGTRRKPFTRPSSRPSGEDGCPSRGAVAAAVTSISGAAAATHSCRRATPAPPIRSAHWRRIARWGMSWPSGQRRERGCGGVGLPHRPGVTAYKPCSNSSTAIENPGIKSVVIASAPRRVKLRSAPWIASSRVRSENSQTSAVPDFK